MLNRVKAMHAAGKPSFGVLATIPSVQVVQVLANSGLDWMLIDMEHGPIGLDAAHAMVVATSGTPMIPFVRVAWKNGWLAKPVMDLGALGIGFPVVKTRAEAEAAVRAVRYPPVGERLWGPFYAPLRWGMSMADYMAAANSEVMAIVVIEHPDAVRNIDEILSVPGIDLAVIGTGDLASALEVPGQFDHPAVVSAVAAAEAAILRSKVPLCGVARTPAQAQALLGRGYLSVMLGFDFFHLQRSIAEFLAALH